MKVDIRKAIELMSASKPIDAAISSRGFPTTSVVKPTLNTATVDPIAHVTRTAPVSFTSAPPHSLPLQTHTTPMPHAARIETKPHTPRRLTVLKRDLQNAQEQLGAQLDLLSTKIMDDTLFVIDEESQPDYRKALLGLINTVSDQLRFLMQNDTLVSLDLNTRVNAQELIEILEEALDGRPVNKIVNNIKVNIYKIYNLVTETRAHPQYEARPNATSQEPIS